MQRQETGKLYKTLSDGWSITGAVSSVGSSNLLMYHVRWENEFFLYSTGDDAHDMLDNFPR